MTNSDDRRKVQVIKEMRGEKLENKYRYVFFLMKTKFLGYRWPLPDIGYSV